MQFIYTNMPPGEYKNGFSNKGKLMPELLAWALSFHNAKEAFVIAIQAGRDAPPAHAQEGPQDARSTHADTEDAQEDKDGPSGAAAEVEAIALSLSKEETPQALWEDAKRLGYTTPEEVRAVIGPASEIKDYPTARAKLVEDRRPF